jgi:hypothetical protein
LIEFGIEPLSFTFDNGKKEFVVFAPFSTEPDHKIFVFKEEGNTIKFKYSFGQSEILLQRIPFPISPFIITPSQEIWTGHCLSLDFQIYTVSGDIFETKSNHIDMLPKPHISPVYFEGFNRLSDALDTYYTFTRFYKFYALDDFVMARYFGPMNVKTNNYYLFFTNEGDPLDILLSEDKSKHICGCCENDIYIYLETDVEEENPAIIRYRLKE